MWSNMLTDYSWWDITLSRVDFWLRLSIYKQSEDEKPQYCDFGQGWAHRRKHNGWYRDWVTFKMDSDNKLGLWKFYCDGENDRDQFDSILVRFYPEYAEEICDRTRTN